MKLETLQVGGITYQVVACPTCGATLRLGYQALAPEYLIQVVACPYCGTTVAHNAVSVEILSGPGGYYPAAAPSGITEMLDSMMPIIMMIMMLAMIMPMMKGVTAGA